MIEKRTGKKMAAKMFDLRANTSDTQQVKSYDYNLLQYYSFVYSQGSATKTFCVHFSCS